MTTTSTPAFEKSTFRLLVLLVITLALVVAASVVVTGESSRVTSSFTPHLMFPNFDIGDATRLTIESQEGSVEITLNDRGNWVVPARAGYLARRGPVQQTIGGLAELELIEPKTSRDDWHHFLGLVAPEDGGEGTEITLYDADDNVLAAVIVGNQPEGAESTLDGRGRIHVRRPDEDQTWLARGTLSLHTDVTEWLATQLYDIDGDRIAQVVVEPPASAPYTLARPSRVENEFELLELPVGREILSPYVLEAVGTALSDMEALDVRPAAELDFTGGFRLTYQTFDGLEVVFTLTDPDGPDGGWATIAARFLGNADATLEEAVALQTEAADINVLADGWAFQLPGFQARQMVLTMDDLLRPEAESTN